MPTKRQRTPVGRFFPTTSLTDEPSSSSSSPACGTSNNPTSPGMTTNMRDRQTVVLFGKPGLRPHSSGRVRGGKGCRGPVKEIQQRLSKRVLVVAVSDSGRASAVRGCWSVLRHPNGDDRTSYCETKKGRDATWDICKGQRNRDLDAAWKIDARYLAVKTGKELGAFNKEVHADRISHDSTPQPMLCEAVSAYRQQARAHS